MPYSITTPKAENITDSLRNSRDKNAAIRNQITKPIVFSMTRQMAYIYSTPGYSKLDRVDFT
jgi:hypothetical protein